MTFTSNQLVPELSVSNFEKSIAFYVDILGFSVSYQRIEEGFAFLVLGEAQLMIDEIGKGRTWKTGELDYPLGRGINFQINVKSIEPLLNNLKQHNIELFLEVEEKWYRKDSVQVGNKQFLVKDPDGYLLRFTEELGLRNLERN
jgi:catechol 2,3-dioxygenase-like lactoylglutathione lyase family enzyme